MTRQSERDELLDIIGRSLLWAVPPETVAGSLATAIRNAADTILKRYGRIPEDGPSREELIEALRLYGDDSEYHIDVLGPCGIGRDRDANGDFGMRARALLSRLPATETNDAK